jgi:hypothetical protein
MYDRYVEFYAVGRHGHGRSNATAFREDCLNRRHKAAASGVPHCKIGLSWPPITAPTALRDSHSPGAQKDRVSS